jgi:hypothetical protein
LHHHVLLSQHKTKQLAIKQTKRSIIDYSVKAAKDWDNVFKLTLDGIVNEEFYKDCYKFLAWKKSGGITQRQQTILSLP